MKRLAISNWCVTSSNMATINDYLPMEMLLEIFEKLHLHHLMVNCSKTCVQWKDIIVRYILRPKILELARANGRFKRLIEEKGWTEDHTDTELTFSLYTIYELHSSKAIIN